MKRPLALVTGASSGIGRAYAQHLAEKEFDLFLVGQNAARLDAVAKRMRHRVVGTLALDLSRASSIETLQSRLPVPDVIVANAGITRLTQLGQTCREDRRRLFYLLCEGVIDLLERQIPRMCQRGSGRVVIISSIAAITPMAKSSIYAAAKAGVAAYGASISDEVRNRGIRVTTSLPGYVRTNAHARAGLHHLQKNIPNWMWMEAEQVVRETETASMQGRKQVVPGRVYRLVRPFLSSSLARIAWQRIARRDNGKFRQLKSQS